MADPITTGRQIYDYFIARGLSPHQAAAIAGNMAHESGGNPGAVNIGDNTRQSPGAPHSFGLSQWNGPRLTGLVDYARQQGAHIPQGDLRDPAYVRGLGQYLPLQTQLGYAWNEMQGPEADAYRRITGAPDLSTAVAGAVGYHRPQGYSAERPEMSLGYSGRLSLADQIMRARSQPDAPLSASGVPIVAAAQMMAPPTPSRREVSMPPIFSGVAGFAEGGEVGRILHDHYGQGFVSPALANHQADPNNETGQVPTYSLADAVNAVPEDTLGLRGAANRVRDASRPNNMLAGGLDTAASWINGTPQVGQDTLAPLGAGVIASFLARPRPHFTHSTERPTEAAIRIGDQTFTGPSHFAAIQNATRKLGDIDNLFGHSGALLSREGIQDGFITNAGRYVTRQEAARLVDGDYATRSFPYMSEAIGLDQSIRSNYGWGSTLAFKDGGRVVHGLDINIEHRKGSTRSGASKDGPRWSVTMPCAYGDIKRTKAADGERVDCYIGSDPSDKVFVVDQVDAKTGKYDEAKVLMNFPSKRDALAAYEKAFSDGKGRARIGSVSEMSVDGFRDWLKSGNTKKPVGDLRKTFADGGQVQPYSSRLSELMLNARPYYRQPVEPVPPNDGSFVPSNLPPGRQGGPVRVIRDLDGDGYRMLPGTNRGIATRNWLQTGLHDGILPPALPQTTDRSGALGRGTLPGPQASLEFARGGTPMTKRYADGGAPVIPGGLPPLPDPPETELDRYYARQAYLDRVTSSPPLPPSTNATLGRESPASRSGQIPITMTDVADLGMQAPQGLHRGIDSLINLPWNLMVRAPAALAGADVPPEGRYLSRFNSDREPTTELGAAGGALTEAIPGIATAGPQWMAAANAARGLAGGLATGYRALPTGSVPAGLAGLGALTMAPGEASTQANRSDPLQAEIGRQEAIISQANKDIQKLNDRVWPTLRARENATAPYNATIQRASDEIQRINEERRTSRTQSRDATQRQRDTQIAEAEAARQRILDDAPTPFQNTMLGRHWGAAPLVMGGITGAIAGARHSIGDRFAVGRLANAIADASAAGRTSQGFRAGNEARNLSEALPRHNSLLAQHLDHMRVPAIVGGLEGLAAPNLPNAWNAMTQPPVNPEYSALQAYLRLLPPDVEGQPALQARARGLLEDRTALPQENPFYRGAIDYYSSGRFVPSMLGSALEGAGAAAFTSGLTGAFAPTPARLAALRAQTEALPQPPLPRPPRGPRGQDNPPPGGPPPPASPPPPPAAPAAQAAPQSTAPPAPQSAAPSTPAPAGAPNATPSEPPHHSHLQPRHRGQFAGPPKPVQRPRNSTPDGNDEARAFLEAPGRNIRGQKDGGLVNRALELARKFGGRAKFADGGAPRVLADNDPLMLDLPMARHAFAFGHGLINPLGITGYAARGAAHMAPDQISPLAARRFADDSADAQAASPVAAGLGTLLVPGGIGGRALGLTTREVLSPGWLGNLAVLGGAGGSIYDAVVGNASRRPLPVLPDAPYAHGGHVSVGSGPVVAGPILGTDGGRDDAKPVSVKSGSFVIPSHVVSGLPGAGSNTLSGMRMLEQFFGKPSPHAMASGGPASDVPIKISSGEFVVTPEQVARIGGGDMGRGHEILDQFCVQVQRQHAKEVAKLPRPATD